MRLLPRLMLACVVMAAASAYGGAWTQPQGSFQLIQTLRSTSASKFWDSNGNRQNQPYYSKYEYRPYLEYGLTPDITLGGSIAIQRVNQLSNNFRIVHIGAGDSELFARLRLWHNDRAVISVEPFVKLPSLSNYLLPAIGNQHTDTGIMVNAGYGFEALGRHHYADISAGYRYRFGLSNDQIHLNGTLGIALDERWTLLPQFFATWRMREPTFNRFTLSPSDDYNQLQLQLSATYQLTESLGVQAGGFTDIEGKNLGIGRGVLVALWTRF